MKGYKGRQGGQRERETRPWRRRSTRGDKRRRDLGEGDKPSRRCTGADKTLEKAGTPSICRGTRGDKGRQGEKRETRRDKTLEKADTQSI